MIRLFLFWLLMLGEVGSLHAQTDLHFEEEQVSDRTVEIYCHNSAYAHYSIRIRFELSNMRSSLESGSVVTVPPGQRKLLATLTSDGGPWSYGFSTDYTIGNVYAIHDDDHMYSLPYMSGRSYRIMQGYNGRFSHTGSNALDWDMDEGTAVLSVRSGTVVEIRAHSDHGCPSPRCIDQANFIKIEHDDGTIADYAHLMKNGVQVKLGQYIQAGELIGYSGNTGWSSGPHLHLKIFISTLDSRPTGIQTRFSTSQGEIFLEEGKSYSH